MKDVGSKQTKTLTANNKKDISNHDYKVALETRDDEYCSAKGWCYSNDCKTCSRALAAEKIKVAQEALRMAARSLRLKWPKMPRLTAANKYDREGVRQYRLAVRELEEFVADYGVWLNPGVAAHVCIEAAAEWIGDADLSRALRKMNKKLWQRLKREGSVF